MGTCRTFFKEGGVIFSENRPTPWVSGAERPHGVIKNFQFNVISVAKRVRNSLRRSTYSAKICFAEYVLLLKLMSKF